MTAIAFHFNVPDKLGYACRLLRKAFRQGASVGVVGETAQLSELDRSLWTFDPVDFLPHARVGDTGPPGGALATHTRVWLAARAADLPHRAVLVNLGPQVPSGFEAFERVIELVDEDEADRQRARQRWKHYQGAGYEIERHEVGRGG
jgi:DNA polymerase III subunit chi